MGASMKVPRFSIFVAAMAIIGFGFLALDSLEKEVGIGFFLGALTLGGALLIAGLFSFSSAIHGLMGAAVLALLGFGRGIFNFPGLASFFAGERERGTAPLLEFGITIICAMLLLKLWRAWISERMRRMLDSDS
jgi:hypothetical protein